MNWRETPFIRLLIPLVLGILLGFLLESEAKEFFFSRISLCSLLLLISINKRTPVTPFSPYFGILTFIFLISFGSSRYLLYNELTSSTHFGKTLHGTNYFLIEVLEKDKKHNAFRLKAKVNQMAPDSCTAHPVSGQLLVYLPIDSTRNAPNPGDYLMIRGYPKPINSPKNPKTFDPAWYFHLKNCHYNLYIQPDDWKEYPKPSRKTMFIFFKNYQIKAAAILQQYLPGDQEFAVAAALIVGYRAALSSEIQELYANTGAIHVLAVSGLHLGFIYFIVYSIFSRLLGQKSHAVFIRIVLSIGILWSFAFFTGGSASVLRAATMLTFVMIGQSLVRFCNIYNSLAASAFLLLCIKPFFLWEIGFQLSYLAVLGIVFFHPIIYHAVFCKHPIIDWVWKLTVVSIAAQLSTFPLSLYYFHQFPTFFWLSGWLVVPAAACILCLGLLLLILSPISGLVQIVGKLLFGVIYVVNFLLSQIEALPGSLLEGIWVDLVTITLVFLIISGVAWTLKFQKKAGAWSIIGSCLVLSFYLAHQKWMWSNQKIIAIYHVRNKSSIDFFDGRKVYTSGPGGSEKTSTYHCKNYRISRGGKTPIYLSNQQGVLSHNLYHQSNLIQFHGTRLAIINKVPISRPPPQPLPVDFILIQESPAIDISEINKFYTSKTIIADASNKWQDLNKWEKHCRELGLTFINIKREGAFILNLSNHEKAIL